MAVSKTYKILWSTGLIFVILPHLNLGLLSDYKICGDSGCESPMSRVQATRDHHGKDCRFLSFRRGDTIFVYHKLTGKREDLWAGSIDKQFGYFPKDAVKEEQVHATMERVVETQESDFLCMDEFGHLIDSSHLDGDDDTDSDDEKIQNQEPETTHTTPHTDDTKSETPSKPEDVSTERPVSAQEADSSSTDLEEDENKIAHDAAAGKPREAQETSEAANEQGGSASSAWLSSSMTGWLGLATEEGPVNFAEGIREDERKETQAEASSFTSSVTGWLGLGGEEKPGDAVESTEEDHRQSAYSLTSTMTGWLGFGGEKKTEHSAEKEQDEERENENEQEPAEKFRSRRMSLDLEGSQLQEEERAEMGTLDWLGNGLSNTLGFGLTNQESEHERTTEGEAEETIQEEEKQPPSSSWLGMGFRDMLGFRRDNSDDDEKTGSDFKETEEDKTSEQLTGSENVDTSQSQPALTEEVKTETSNESKMEETLEDQNVSAETELGTDITEPDTADSNKNDFDTSDRSEDSILPEDTVFEVDENDISPQNKLDSQSVGGVSSVLNGFFQTGSEEEEEDNVLDDNKTGKDVQDTEVEDKDYQMLKSVEDVGEDNNQEQADEEIKTESDVDQGFLTQSDIKLESDFNSDAAGESVGTVEEETESEVEGRDKIPHQTDNTEVSPDSFIKNGARGDGHEGESSNAETDVLQSEIYTSQTDDATEQESSGDSQPYLSSATTEERNEPVFNGDDMFTAHSEETDVNSLDSLAMFGKNTEAEHEGELGQEGEGHPVEGSSLEFGSSKMVLKNATEEDKITFSTESTAQMEENPDQEHLKNNSDAHMLKETDKEIEKDENNIQPFQTETIELDEYILNESGQKSNTGSETVIEEGEEKQAETEEGEVEALKNQQEEEEEKQELEEEESKEEEEVTALKKQQELEEEKQEEVEELMEEGKLKETKELEMEEKQEGEEETKDEENQGEEKELKEEEEVKPLEKHQEVEDEMRDEMEELKVEEKQEGMGELKEGEKQEVEGETKEEENQGEELKEDEKLAEVMGLKEDEEMEELKNEMEENVRELKEDERGMDLKEVEEVKEKEKVSEEKQVQLSHIEVEMENTGRPESESNDKETQGEISLDSVLSEASTQAEKLETEYPQIEEETTKEENQKAEEVEEEKDELKEEEVEEKQERRDREEEGDLTCLNEPCPQASKDGFVSNRDGNDSANRQSSIDEGEKETGKENPMADKDQILAVSTGVSQTVPSESTERDEDRKQEEERKNTDPEAGEGETKTSESSLTRNEEVKSNNANSIPDPNALGVNQIKKSDCKDNDQLCSGESGQNSLHDHIMLSQTAENKHDQPYSTEAKHITLSDDNMLHQEDKTKNEYTETNGKKTEQIDSDHKLGTKEDNDREERQMNGKHDDVTVNEGADMQMNKNDGSTVGSEGVIEISVPSGDHDKSQDVITEQDARDASQPGSGSSLSSDGQSKGITKTEGGGAFGLLKNAFRFFNPTPATESTESDPSLDSNTDETSEAQESLTPEQELDLISDSTQVYAQDLHADSSITLSQQQQQQPSPSPSIQTSTPSPTQNIFQPNPESLKTGSSLQTKTLSKQYKNLLTYLSADEMTILIELFGRHKLQFLDYILGSSDSMTDDPENDESILSDIERLLHYHKETLVAPGMRSADAPQEEEEKTRTLIALQNFELLLAKVRETFNTGKSDISNTIHQAKAYKDKEIATKEESSKVGDSSVGLDTNNPRDQRMGMATSGYMNGGTGKEGVKEDEKRGERERIEEKRESPESRLHIQEGPSQPLEGVLEQILDSVHQIAEYSTTHIHEAKDLLILLTVQVRFAGLNKCQT